METPYRMRISLSLTVIVASAILATYFFQRAQAVAQTDVKAERTDIVVRGRIEPSTRVLALAGPTPGGIVKELRVRQGQKVTKGEVVAFLEGYDVQREALVVAERSLRYAEVQHEQTMASSKPSELAAQRNLIVAREADVERLQIEKSRQDKLLSGGFITSQYIEKVRSDLVQAHSSVLQAENTLRAMSEFRTIDKKLALSKVDQERATVKLTQAELERTIVRAPFNGEILSIECRPGEAVGADGIMRIADTSSLLVVAEVDEHLFPRIHQNMKAYIEGVIIAGQIEAKVSLISAEIFKQKRPTSDVLIGRDAHVIEVELSPLHPLPLLLGAEVTVRFLDSLGSR